MDLASRIPRQYKVDDGLPSEQVYRAFQDQQGFMWFCTDRGLSQFDGSNFSTFSVEQGLPDNVVLEVKQANDGAFYCMTLSGKFFILDSGKVKDAPLHNQLSLSSVGNGIMAYSTHPVNPIIYSITDGINSYQYVNGKVVAQPFDFDQNSQIYFNKNLGIWAFNQKYRGDNSYYYKENDDAIQIGVNLDEIDWQRVKTGLNIPKCHWLNTGNSGYLVAIENGLYRVDSNSIWQVHRFEHTILCLEQDMNNQDQYYVGLKNGGLTHFSLSNRGINVLENVLTDCFISDVFHDRSGGIWVTSLFNGIFYYPHFVGLKTLAVWPNEVITCIDVYDNQIFTGSNTGNFRVFENGTWKDIYKGFEPVSSITKVQNSLLVSFTNYSVFFNLQNNEERIHSVGRISYLGLPHTDVIGSNIISAGHRLVALLSAEGTVLDKKLLVKSMNPPSRRTNDVICLNNKAVLATINGLRIFGLSNHADSLIYIGSTLVGKNVKAISAYKSQSIIAGTAENGIYIYRDGQTKELTYGGNRIYATPNCMALINDSMLALGVNHGIMLLELNNDEIVNIHTINKNIGLQSNKTYSLHRYTDGTFLSSSGIGLERLNPEEILSAIDAPVVLKSVTIDGIQNKKKRIELKNSFSELRLEYAALDFSKGSFIGYKYRVNKKTANWIYTSSNSISLTSLAPGEYKVEITTAIKNNNAQGSIIIPIFVKAPFYKTQWFWLISTLCLIAIVLLFSKARIKRIRTIQKLFKLEYRALGSQMNPHFLFNALSSIQGFIVNGEKKRANEFIVQFASLIRTNLNLSEINEISVSQELDMLQNYLALEKMRFSDHFDFSIDVGNLSKEDLKDLKVPRMLLQPIVENAILHGVRHLKKKGQIDIKFSKDDRLRVEIRDNGIGRIASEKINSEMRRKPKSMATKNIEKRIQLMKEIKRQKVEMETLDLYDSDGLACGTKVIFVFGEIVL